MFFKDEAQADQYMKYLEGADPTYQKFTPNQKQAYRQHILETNGPSAPGSSVDNPVQGTLFNGDKERLESGFMSPDLLKQTMTAKGRGFTDVATNSNGNIVAKTPEGAWVEEGGPNQVGEDKKPIGAFHRGVNWVERNISGAPKLAGLALGGTAGGALGALAGPTAAIAGGIGGADVGSAAGEALKQKIGNLLGVDQRKTTDPQVLNELSQAGTEGALSEAGGQLLNKIPIPYSGKLSTTGERLNVGGALHELASYPAAAYSHLVSGLPFEAARRQFLRPQELGSITAQKAAQAAESELEATKQRLGQGVGEAEKQFINSHGDELTDTSVPLQKHLARVAEKAPDEKGLGALTPEEEQSLKDIGHKVYTTEVPEEVAPKPAVPDLEQSRTLGEVDVAPEVQTRQVPQISYGDAVNALKGVSSQLQSVQTKRLASPGASVGQNEALLLKLQGDLINMIKTKSPDYAAKKGAYAQFQQEQYPLLKGLIKPQGQEASAVKLTKPNKTTNRNMYEAAQQAIPNSMKNELGDLDASQALDQYGWLPDSKRLWASVIAGGALAGMNPGSLTHAITSNPSELAPALAFSAIPAAIMSPKGNTFGLSGAGRVSRSGQLLPTLLESDYNPWAKIQRKDQDENTQK